FQLSHHGGTHPVAVLRVHGDRQLVVAGGATHGQPHEQDRHEGHDDHEEQAHPVAHLPLQVRHHQRGDRTWPHANRPLANRRNAGTPAAIPIPNSTITGVATADTPAPASASAPRPVETQPLGVISVAVCRKSGRLYTGTMLPPKSANTKETAMTKPSTCASVLARLATSNTNIVAANT